MWLQSVLANTCYAYHLSLPKLDCLTDEQMAKLVGNDSVPGDCGSKGIAIGKAIFFA